MLNPHHDDIIGAKPLSLQWATQAYLLHEGIIIIPREIASTKHLRQRQDPAKDSELGKK
jgi:hypothetical protein